MGTGLTLFWFGTIVAAVSAVGIDSLNPLSKLNSTFNPLSIPASIQSAPGKVKDQVFGNTEERTFTDYYFGGHKFATVITDNETGNVLDCMLVGDREFIAYMIGDKCTEWKGPLLELANDAPSIPIINVSTAIMDDWIAKCNGREPSNDTRPLFQKFFSGLKNGPRTILKHAVIFPGTKWCGAGDVARDYDDLGQMAETDKCCRDHDHAIESMQRGEDKYGLQNKLLYTMTKCTDDEKFNKCLYDADSIHAAAVGTTYFNVLKTKCFDKRKQARCAKQLFSVLTPCREYVYDENSPETWQVFDAIPFVPNSSLPMQKINGILHAAPGLGDFLTAFV